MSSGDEDDDTEAKKNAMKQIMSFADDEDSKGLQNRKPDSSDSGPDDGYGNEDADKVSEEVLGKGNGGGGKGGGGGGGMSGIMGLLSKLGIGGGG